MRKLSSLLVAVAASTRRVRGRRPDGDEAAHRLRVGRRRRPASSITWMDNGFYVQPTQTMPNPNHTSAWTYVDASQAPGVVTTGHAYKGWITATDSPSSHRPYPILDRTSAGDTPFAGPVVVNEWRVYLDQGNAGKGVGTSHWIQFATLGNIGWYDNLMRFNVDDGKVVAEGAAFQYVGPTPQPEFPIGKRVTYTVYKDFENDVQTWHLWQDGVSIFHFSGTNPGVAISSSRTGGSTRGTTSRAGRSTTTTSRSGVCRSRSRTSERRRRTPTPTMADREARARRVPEEVAPRRRAARAATEVPPGVAPAVATAEPAPRGRRAAAVREAAAAPPTPSCRR